MKMRKYRMCNLVLIISAILFGCLNSNCHSSSNSVKLNNQTEDTLRNFIDTLIKTKVAYEKSLYFSDSLQLVLRNEYFSKVKTFKENKVVYIQYINKVLNENNWPKDRFVQFSYIPPYESTIPKCIYLKYSEFLKLLVYNLEKVQSDTTIICK